MENISNVTLAPDTYTFKAYVSLGEVSQSSSNTEKTIAFSGVTMKLEGVNEIESSSELTNSHTIMEVVPVIGNGVNMK
jgi:hypothetical protein